MERESKDESCISCKLQFGVFRRRRVCSECGRQYCGTCLERGTCPPCRVLTARPPQYDHMRDLKVQDILSYLQRQNVSTRGCFERSELEALCVSHACGAGAGARRRARGPQATALSSLKRLTNNFNNFFNSALGPRPYPAPPPPPRESTGGCHNSAHCHAPPADTTHARERFTTRPGGEADISVPVPEPCASPPDCTPRRDTADCFEIEDLDEQAWEFIPRPAEPLPNDSEVLLSTPEPEAPIIVEPPSPQRVPDQNLDSATDIEPPPTGLQSTRRAASEFELRSPEPVADADSVSLHDEPVTTKPVEPNRIVSLEGISSELELRGLAVRQLKRLLARNGVEYRGCVERAELEERALALWRDHRRDTREPDALPLEECCKVCMAARVDCVLVDCGHMVVCVSCARRLHDCPVCRRYVLRPLRVFRS